jgi:hypothetical protein
VDLDRLTTLMVAALDERIQPAVVSLWLGATLQKS